MRFSCFLFVLAFAGFGQAQTVYIPKDHLEKVGEGQAVVLFAPGGGKWAVAALQGARLAEAPKDTSLFDPLKATVAKTNQTIPNTQRIAFKSGEAPADAFDAWFDPTPIGTSKAVGKAEAPNESPLPWILGILIGAVLGVGGMFGYARFRNKPTTGPILQGTPQVATPSTGTASINQQIFDALRKIYGAVQAIPTTPGVARHEVEAAVSSNLGTVQSDLRSLKSLLEESRSRTSELETGIKALSGEVRDQNLSLAESKEMLVEGFGHLDDLTLRQGESLGRGLQEVSARVPNLPLTHRPLDLGDRLNQLSEFAAGLESGGSVPAVDAAFLLQCRREIEGLQRLLGQLVPGWQPAASALAYDLPEVYMPRRPVSTAELSRTNRDLLRVLQREIDDVRADLRDDLRTRFGVTEIEIAPERTRYNVDLHEESVGHRLPTPDRDRNNVIYEKIQPGFLVGGTVHKALVKRYVYLESATPAPAGPTGPAVDQRPVESQRADEAMATAPIDAIVEAPVEEAVATPPPTVPVSVQESLPIIPEETTDEADEEMRRRLGT